VSRARAHLLLVEAGGDTARLHRHGLDLRCHDAARRRGAARGEVQRVVRRRRRAALRHQIDGKPEPLRHRRRHLRLGRLPVPPGRGGPQRRAPVVRLRCHGRRRGRRHAAHTFLHTPTQLGRQRGLRARRPPLRRRIRRHARCRLAVDNNKQTSRDNKQGNK